MSPPTRPSRISVYAEATLQALAAAGLGHKISLGGALVALRSAQLDPTTTLPWVDVAIDSLRDLVASKMVALVERGAPRDFRDIYALCMGNKITARECWRLWRERQQRSRSDPDPGRARVAIETHLSRIALHRPLSGIRDPEQQAAAAALRGWFMQEFLDALVD